MLSLSHALNLEARLADRTYYPAPSLAGHPGVPFYLTSWLALKASVPSTADVADRLSQVFDNAEAFFLATEGMAIAIGAASIFSFVMVGGRLANPLVCLLGLGLWVASSHQSLLTVLSLQNETFALALNVVFIAVVYRVARSDRLRLLDALWIGLVSAAAYLVKISYLYIPIAIAAALLTSLAIRHRPERSEIPIAGLACVIFVAAIMVIGYGVIGKPAFHALLAFHWSVLTHAGLYGHGASGLVSEGVLRETQQSAIASGALAIPLALAGGAFGSICSVLRYRQRCSEAADAIVGVGLSVAAMMSALIVIKHYAEHYVAGVSATLPGLAIMAFRDLESRRLRTLYYSTLTLIVAGCLVVSWPRLLAVCRAATEFRAELSNDRRELENIIADRKGVGLYTYGLPLREASAGFVMYYAGLGALEREYAANKPTRMSPLQKIAQNPNTRFDYVIVSKSYYPDQATVISSTTLDPSGVLRIHYEPGDKIIELRRMFIILKSQL